MCITLCETSTWLHTEGPTLAHGPVPCVTGMGVAWVSKPTTGPILEKYTMVFYGKYKIYSSLDVEVTYWAWILR